MSTQPGHAYAGESVIRRGTSANADRPGITLLRSSLQEINPSRFSSMTRLDPTRSTTKRLFALSGNKCAFPGCTRRLVNRHGDLIADVCHIEAANEDSGPRYNHEQSDDQRREIANLLVLCPSHHRETNNIEEFPVAKLLEIKRKHEQLFSDSPSPFDPAWLQRLAEQAAEPSSPRDLIALWRHALRDEPLGRYLSGRASLLRRLVTTEAEYFETSRASREADRLFRPLVFQRWRAAEDHESALLAQQIVGSPGLAVVMADFTEDVHETARWLRHCLRMLDTPGGILPIYLPVRSLIEASVELSARYVRKELLEAPLDHAGYALEALREAAVSSAEGEANVVLIVNSAFELPRISSAGDAISAMTERFLDLRDDLQRTRTTIVLLVPRHFLLLESALAVMERSTQTWVSSPLFDRAPDRRAQLATLLEHARPTALVDLEVSRVASFARCNSNGLIYALAEAPVVDDWRPILSESLRQRGYWDPAIRLAEAEVTIPVDGYVSIPIDVHPDADGIYGYLDGPEAIPASIDEAVLCSEAGGGKTTAIEAVREACAFPRTTEHVASTAWLPLLTTEDLRPQSRLVQSLIDAAGRATVECLPLIVSSPPYLLIDDAEELPREISGFKISAARVGSRVGLLLTHRVYPGLTFESAAFPGVLRLELRALTPELASRISGEPIAKMLATWALIGLPHSRLCQNPFVLRHCATELVKGNETDDRTLTDILHEALANVPAPGSKDRRDEILENLLPLLAAYGMRTRRPAVFDEERLKACLAEKSLDGEYDIGWLSSACTMGLMSRIGGVAKAYAFRQTIYFEYFAARHLAVDEEERTRALEAAAHPRRGKRWYECLRLMIPLLDESTRRRLLEDVASSTNHVLFGVLLSGLRPSQLRALVLSVAPAVAGARPPAGVIESRFQTLCKPPERERLSALGVADPRVLLLTLRPDEACRVLCYDSRSVEDGRWGAPFELDGLRYQLARYPVTNLEFYQFVKEGGYSPRGAKYWESQPRGLADNGGLAWLHETQPERPRYWALPGEGRPDLRRSNCPVVGITLHEAKAYCHWLAERDGPRAQQIRLPRAAEWTWAALARWPRVRAGLMSILPDGVTSCLEDRAAAALDVATVTELIEHLGPEMANLGPAPVGLVHDDVSGCSDLFGNVWEWCDTLFDDYRTCVRGGPGEAPSLLSLLTDGVFVPRERNELVGFRVLRELDSTAK